MPKTSESDRSSGVDHSPAAAPKTTSAIPQRVTLTREVVTIRDQLGFGKLTPDDVRAVDSQLRDIELRAQEAGVDTDDSFVAQITAIRAQLITISQ